MDEHVKHRLVGAAVLVTVAVVVVPMILGKSDEAPAPPEPRGAEASLSSPRTQDDVGADVRVVPLDAPAAAPDRAPEREASAPRSEAPATVPASAREETEPRTEAPADAQTRYAVQLGSFSEEKNATALRDRLISKGYRAYVETATGGSAPITRVLVGPQSDRQEAERMLRRLRGETKLEGLIVRYRG